jgi:site-specific recombinase XerD
MKTNEFSFYLQKFFLSYLANELGASPNTIASYRDCFSLLLVYFKEKRKVQAEKLSIGDLYRDSVKGFLDWLEQERGCKTTTRNVRLGAIHSFCRFMQFEDPANLLKWQEILSIKVKCCEKGSLSYMPIEGIKALLELPDTSKKQGRRDLSLLALMYESAARVQELCDLKPSDLRLEKPYTIRLVGKGNKQRIVPLEPRVAVLMTSYLCDNGLSNSESLCKPLFQNRNHEKLTRTGISFILGKYISQLRREVPDIVPKAFTCHCMRHSKAMHLLQGGVNLVYIRDILGHASVLTTEIYAKADSKQKREALEKAYSKVLPDVDSVWQNNHDLLDWLRSLV